MSRVRVEANGYLVGAALWAADIESMDSNMTDETAPSLQEGEHQEQESGVTEKEL